MVTPSPPAKQAGSIPSRALYNIMPAKADKLTAEQRVTNETIHPIKKAAVHRPTVAQVEDAIRKAAGNVTAAARGLGVNRTNLHARIAKSPDLQRVLQEERESLVDMAESALRAEVLDRNMTAVIWTLKASPEAKRRGWGERTEIAGPDGGPVAHEHEHRGQVHGSVEHIAAVVAALVGVGAIPLPGTSAGDAAEDDAVHTS